MSDYVPFYCDRADRIVYGRREDWCYCPLCGASLSASLQLELTKTPPPARVPHGFDWNLQPSQQKR